MNNRCLDRLAYLQELSNGWHDGSGKAPTHAAITAAYQWLDDYPILANVCYIFPTDAGGVLIEFVDSEYDYSVELMADGDSEMSSVSIT